MKKIISGAQAAIEQIIAEGVTDILSIPGEHNLPLCDTLLDYPQLRVITARTEQGLTYMSNGYSRVSHTIAVPIVISGPGVTNSLSALADAYQDSVPMVLIVTQAPLNQIGKGAFHEIKDQSATISSIVKWYKRVTCVEEIPEAIHHAFLNAFGNRPGPTAIEIPLDILTQKGHSTIYSSAIPFSLKPDLFSIEKAAQLLINAKKPVIYVGRGAVISACEKELKDLAEWLEIPCFTTALAKGVLPDNHYLNISWGGCKYGMIKTFFQQADVVLVVGSSLDDSDARRFSLKFPDKLIQIDISNENMNRDYSVSVELTGDAKTVLTQLLSEIKQHPKQNNLSTKNAIEH
ncbi:acetolactate synthase, large subunit, partial [Candidatus Magnetomorum sp. HK-1]